MAEKDTPKAPQTEQGVNAPLAAWEHDPDHMSANKQPQSKVDLPTDDQIEGMDAGEVITHLERLGIPTDRSASLDALRAALRRAPETIAERESTLAAEQGVAPAKVKAEDLTPQQTH